ncbi:unnamed protein product [Lymnaea stagnalis]|uniref:Seipin n=1 Tax=Lymnaea stagnalis TaxID=6523 RepID=A0AAV2HCZ5_LYMST
MMPNLKINMSTIISTLQMHILRSFTFVFNLITWPARTLTLFSGMLLNVLLNKAKSTLQKVLFLLVVYTTLMVVAVLFFALFYHVYVPTAEINRPVNLVFSVCSSGVGICSFPSGNATFWSEDGTFQEVLGLGQPYTVILELELPDSPTNRDLGMFMVSLKMYDREGLISLTSHRSALLKYRSIISRVIDLFVWSPFYFIDFWDQKQTLKINMFSHYVDDYYHPSVGAVVEVHSHKIEIYSSTLKFFAKLTGMKYILYYWPILSAALAVFFNTSILALGMLVAWLQKNETLKRIAEVVQLSDDKQIVPGKPSKSTVTSFTMTEDLNTDNKEIDDPRNVDDQLVHEPLDDDGMDFVNELRQRRIN